MKRFLAAALTALALAGCGIGAVQIHPGSASRCGWHAWRMEQDARHGHLGWGAYQAWRTAHACPRLLHH